jgi:dual specificity tyrosine-phosphorylation-regulated kinase 2/3/4
LVVLEHHSIIHCDLKPENILLVSPNSSQIKVVDFGSSSFQDGKLFTYIQSRYYRAPEVIMELPYDCRIDIWSLACILAELFTGRPLFSGKDEFEQIRQFIAVLGPPPQPMLQRCRQSVREVIAATRGPTTELWQVIDPGRREVEFVSMLSQMLAWDRNCRLSPSAALAHPFFTGSRPISAQTGSAKYSAHPGNSQPVALTAQPLSSRLETPFVPPTPLSYITQLNQPYPSTLSFSQSSSHVPGGGLGNTSNCSAPAHGPSAELSNSTSSSTLRAQPKASTMRAAFASDAKATPRDRVPPRVQNLSSYSASTAGGGNAASSGISRQAPASRGPPPQQLFHTQLLHEQHMARERLAGPRAGHTQPGRNVQPQTWASR